MPLDPKLIEDARDVVVDFLEELLNQNFGRKEIEEVVAHMRVVAKDFLDAYFEDDNNA